jgi:hypothetical protein
MFRVFEEIARLGREPHNHARAFVPGPFDTLRATPFPRHGFEDVFRRFELDLRDAALFLDLVLCRVPRAEVCHGGRHDQRVALRRFCQHRLQHLLCGFHRKDTRANRWNQRGGRCDQRDLRAHIQRGLGEGIALPAGGAVGEHAHGVERLLRSSRRDRDPLPGERTVPPEQEAHMADDLRRLEHASHAGEPRGEMPLRRSNEGRAALLQDPDIFLHRRVVVHTAVHGGGDQKGGAHCQRSDRQQVICLPVRQFCDGVRGAGRDDEQVGGVPQPHVQNVRLVAPEIFVRVGAPARDGLECERRDEFFRRAGEDHIHLRAGLREPGRQVRGFIHRDGTGDPERDPFSREAGHICLIILRGKLRVTRLVRLDRRGRQAAKQGNKAGTRRSPCGANQVLGLMTPATPGELIYDWCIRNKKILKRTRPHKPSWLVLCRIN